MRKLVVFIVFTGCLCSLATGSANPGDVAVIVSKQNEVDSLSFRELVDISRQDRQHWRAGNKKIYLVLQEAGTTEKEVLLRRIYKMSDTDLKRFWMLKIFTGEITTFPKTLSSSESVKRFISQVPNAIGFIDASVADGTVKTLRIDGKLPGESDYALSPGS